MGQGRTTERPGPFQPSRRTALVLQVPEHLRGVKDKGENSYTMHMGMSVSSDDDARQLLLFFSFFLLFLVSFDRLFSNAAVPSGSSQLP